MEGERAISIVRGSARVTQSDGMGWGGDAVGKGGYGTVPYVG